MDTSSNAPRRAKQPKIGDTKGRTLAYAGPVRLLRAHYKPSRTVETWEQIQAAAGQLVEYFNACNGFLPGNRAAIAISHCQVSEDPWNFFVVAQELVTNEQFPAQVIINARINSSNTPYWALEGCMSFPHREPKKVQRLMICNVTYQHPKDGKLVEVTEDCFGQKAQAFQHAIDHAKGLNIYKTA